ncbi:CHAT domain-containing protein [Actinoplanes italicus]|uniref:CHAT domain-containing protein n=1 Tax=Actinoplanes italicus TaxID=113567 RepID=UPI001473F865|nr:CHAT domain-containing protein [Actinoplanes italicus]
MSDQDEVIARYAAIASAVAGHGDLDDALSEFERLPETTPGRAQLAAGLVEAVFKTGTIPGPLRARALPGLLAAADADPPEAPGWPRTRTGAEVLMIVQAAAESRVADPRASLERLEKLAAENPGDPGLHTLFASARTALRLAVAAQQGDIGAVNRMRTEVADFVAGLPPELAHLPEAEALTRMTGMIAEQRYDPAAIQDTIANLPPGGAVRAAFDEVSADLPAVAALMREDSPQLTDGQLAAFAAHAEQPGLSPGYRALLHSQAGLAALRGGRETDAGRIALGLGHLRQALKNAGPDDPQSVFHLGVLATALIRRYETGGTRDDLREAAGLVNEARERAGGPDHPEWQLISEMSGQIGQLLGDRPDSYREALAGLRGTVWKVLVQPDLASATVAVRSAGDEAIAVARQCLTAGDPAAAITALDAGRGLALFSATADGSITDRLAEAGQTALAERWRAAAATGDPAALSSELRRAVMTALTTSSLLDPPHYAEIQQALTHLDADALVYLVPGEKVRPGHAVIAPASGPPSYLTLTSLSFDAIPQLDEYLSALAQRDLGPADEPAGSDGLTARLAEIGRWAWDAGMRQLIETYLPRMPGRTGRPPRIVLIPMGDLSRIPWQAARGPDGRYAVESIAISQAASARMLVRSATLPAVPLTPTGLIVGDPESPPQAGAGPLPAARLEAYAIRQVFYPGARYLGRRPDESVSRSGRGTADEVRAWLTTPGPLTGGVLHLACHGFVRTGGARASAYLQLAAGSAGNDQGLLTAEELVALLSGVPERGLGLVVLAACQTGLSLSGFDEAYSLGTAFLAGGARTVLSSQWNVPDSATSALMFMVHRNLRVNGLPSWAALREAQLWMLDPHREIPADMPAALRARLDGVDFGVVAAWAAFVHGGQ